MDWSAAIETNREALRRILIALVAMTGLRGRFAPEVQSCCANGTTTGGEGGDAAAGSGDPAAMGNEERPTLPRHLHRAVLRLLRPAEAAARRLIIVTARDLVVTPQARKREIPTPPPPRFAWSSFGPPVNRRGSGGAAARSPGSSLVPHEPTLPLFDPLPRWRGRRRPVLTAVPRISFPGYGTPALISPRQPPMPDDPIDATRLALRLRAVAAALDDLPAHASRFARWRARRDAALHPPPRGEGRGEAAGWGSRTVAPRPAIPRSAPVARPSFELPQGRGWKGRVWPLRPGRPPGWRAAGRRSHPVHDLLVVVHDLAFWAMERSDTS